MDLVLPDKSTDETIAEKLDQNLIDSKDEKGEEHFKYGHQGMNGFDSNHDQPGTAMQNFGVNDKEPHSCIMKSNSPGSSPPSKNRDYMDEEANYHNTEGQMAQLEDYYTHTKIEETEYVGLSDELIDSNTNETFNSRVKTENFNPSIHEVDDNIVHEMDDSEVFNHPDAKSPSIEPTNEDSRNVSGYTQSEKAEFVNKGMNDGNRTHHIKTKEDYCPSEAVPSEKGRVEGKKSGLYSPREIQNATHLQEKKQLSVTQEMSPRAQPSRRQEERRSPANSNRKVEPSPSPSKRKRSVSPEKRSISRKRASSRDRSSPSERRKSPSDKSTHRDSHHKEKSPRKRSPASPRRRESPRRRDKSASRSPVRRRDSSGHRRDHRGRSRSKSPYSRDRSRRSPRIRHSPRRRSSPSINHSRRRSPRRSPASRRSGVGRPGNNLFIAGFSYSTSTKDLERKFSRFGNVKDVRVVRERRSGDSRGYGFLAFEKDEDADAAIRALDQTEWNGRIILVEKSKTALR